MNLLSFFKDHLTNNSPDSVQRLEEEFKCMSSAQNQDVSNQLEEYKVELKEVLRDRETITAKCKQVLVAYRYRLQLVHTFIMFSFDTDCIPSAMLLKIHSAFSAILPTGLVQPYCV